MQKKKQESRIVRGIIVAIDLLVLNIILSFFFYVYDFDIVPFSAYINSQVLYFTLSMTYCVCVFLKPPILYWRRVRSEQIVGRVFVTVVWFSVLSFLAMSYMGANLYPWHWALGVDFLLLIGLLITRLSMHWFINKYRRMGRNRRDVVFIGSNINMLDLYAEMMNNPSTGYRVLGYFDDEPHARFPLPYLGTVDKAFGFLEEYVSNNFLEMYCCLPSARAEEIMQLIDFCENHLIRFYSVPNVRNYLRRPMQMVLVGSVPVLYVRDEPLQDPLNRFVKRTFDLIFSGLFLCTIFPFVFIVVGIITKITSPGPIFFKQKRNGLNGKEFYCYKFRSMKVNTQADMLQATKDDPRKTKFGNFLRKSSIDELPQFINAFKGDMSVVGPRPHMLKHTKEYSELIDKYMVRHFLKPGITGWAQVNGCRGETKTLRQMEERVKKDIWYVENWSFWLDLRIIYMTVRNAIRGESNAY